ncbi:glycosyltransferase [Pseudohongiella spirulinae]|nr:glycosyltransferase [Pseudohongiella spirulinae]
MATYNGSKYLQEQLNSFLLQTRLPHELVVSDDASKDDTCKIIEEFSVNAPFDVRLIRNRENSGYSANFNKALLESKGDLVFLSDQDDVWFSDKIEHMLSRVLDNPDTLLFMNDAQFTNEALVPVNITKLGQIRSAGLSDTSFVMGCCICVRRELLNICLPIPDDFGSHDGWLVRFGIGLNTRIIDKKVLQYYRRHSSNTSNVIFNNPQRISYLDLFPYYFKVIFGSNSHEEEKSRILKNKLILSRLDLVLAKRSILDTKRLLEFRESTVKELFFLEKHLKIRTRPFLPRLFQVTCSFVVGDYFSIRGFRVLLQDIVGE